MKLIESFFTELGRQRFDDLGDNRLQNETFCSRPRHLVGHPQRLLQRLVERAGLQTNERFPQIRFLPGTA